MTPEIQAEIEALKIVIAGLQQQLAEQGGQIKALEERNNQPIYIEGVSKQELHIYHHEVSAPPVEYKITC